MNNDEYKLNNCRICNADVIRFLDLGATHPPEEFRTKEELSKPIVTYPLGLSYCTKCWEVQLSHEIPADVMYKQNYFYDYSITKQGNKHYTDLANIINERYKLTKDDLVIDVGSNTGKLLYIFQNMGVKILGIDPATKLVLIARDNGIPTIDSYFGPKVANDVVKEHGQARIITCNNVFDHVSDLHEYMDGLNILLKKDGVFIAEVPYFATFVKTLNHVVYHQQLDYVLVKSFSKLFEQHNMEIIDCEKIPYHGGSLRLYAAFKGQHKVSEHVNEFIKEEEGLFKDRIKVLESFATAVLNQRDEMVKKLKELKTSGKSIAGVGMSAKGNVLLFYSGIGKETIDFITEKSELKIGRYTPSGIPILKEQELIDRKPDYGLLLAWNFTSEVLENLKEYTTSGGKFIVPIPKMKVIE